MADTNTYVSKQKVEKWTTKEKFNALDLSTIETGTEYNLSGAIEESDLDVDLQTKIDGKLTAPTTPTAESAVTMLADGTVGTKLLSEIGGGGKLYRHYITLSGEGYDSYFNSYSTKNSSFTIEELGNIFANNLISGTYSGGNGSGVILANGSYTGGDLQVTLEGVIVGYDNTSLPINTTGHFNDAVGNFSDTVTEL